MICGPSAVDCAGDRTCTHGPKVASGAYASESEVIGEGLLALEAQEADIERWLKETVAPTYEDALILIDEVFDGLLKRSEARKTQKTC
jgi:Arc/MetJ-type ribon-helix-helix transcriptional regulator